MHAFAFLPFTPLHSALQLASTEAFMASLVQFFGSIGALAVSATVGVAAAATGAAGAAASAGGFLASQPESKIEAIKAGTRR